MTGRLRFHLGMGGLLVLAAWTRLETLGQRPLWFDERYTFFIGRSLRRALTVAVRDGWEHPPLHYVVTSLAMRVSHAPAAVRLPSALCGVLTVLLVALLGRRLFDPRTGLLAGLLLALSVYHIDASMDARPYAMLLLLLVGEYLALFRYRETGERWLLFPLALSAAAAMYTHHLALAAQAGVGIIVAADLLGAVRQRHHDRLRALAGLAAAGLGVILLYLPQAANLLRYLRSEKLEQQHFLRLSGRFVWHLTARWSAGDNLLNVVTLAASVAGLSVVVLRQRRAAVLLPCLLAPFLPFLLVPFGKFFDIRFVIAALPPFVLLVAAGLVGLGEGIAALLARWARLSSVRGRPAAIAAGVLTLALVTGSLAGYRVYRRTTEVCSEFFEQPELLYRDGGFCRERIILNTLNPSDRFLLRPAHPAR